MNTWIIRLSSFLAVLVLLSAIPFVSSGAATITSCVDLSHVRRNERGNGWVWDNLNDTLTLSDVNIDTNADYGLRLPEKCTIILEGNNYISAKVAAMTFSGDAEIKGNGSLTLVGGDTGIWNYSQKTSESIRFLSGSYNITAGKDGMKSPVASLMLVGGKFDISVPDGNALNGRIVRVMQSSLKAHGSLFASYDLTLRDADVTAESNESVLQTSADGKISLTDVKISAGNQQSSVTPVDEYSGEKAVVLKAAGNRLGESAVFGAGCPKFVDYILIADAVLAVAAVIVLPILAKKKKRAAALKRSEEYIARAEAEFKAEKKNRRK